MSVPAMADAAGGAACSAALVYGAEVNPFAPTPPPPPDARTLGAGMGRRQARADATGGGAVARVHSALLEQLTAACERPFAVAALPLRRPARSQAEQPRGDAQRARNRPNKVRVRRRSQRVSDNGGAAAEAESVAAPQPPGNASAGQRRAEREHVQRRRQGGALGREPLPSATAAVRGPELDAAGESACGPYSQEYGTRPRHGLWTPSVCVHSLDMPCLCCRRHGLQSAANTACSLQRVDLILHVSLVLDACRYT